MAVARRTFLAAAMASVVAPVVRGVAWADTAQIKLKLHHAFSSVSSVHDGFLAPWARQIEVQSGGRIRIDIFPSMQLGGQPAQLFDQARDGVVDIVWAMAGSTPSRFPKIEAFELPFVPACRALVSSKAIDDYAAANLQDEFRAVHPICFSCADRGVIHCNREVQTVADMKGLRLHVQTRLAADAVRALGARAVPMPSAQLPMAIARRVVDGCVDPWDMVPALRLDDQLKMHTDFTEASLSTTTFVLAMNKAAYERLPADLATVIDNNSRQVAAGMAGAMWDRQAAAVTEMVGQRGDPIITLMPEAVAHWRKATETVVEAWLKQMKTHGIDGDKLLAEARALLATYANEPEPAQPSGRNIATPAEQNPQARADLNTMPNLEPSPSPVAKPAAMDAAAAPIVKPAAAPPVVKPAPASPPNLDIPL